MGEWARFMTGRGRHILPSLLNASIERAGGTRAKIRRVVSLGRCGKSQKPDRKFLQAEETNLRKEIMVREMSRLTCFPRCAFELNFVITLCRMFWEPTECFSVPLTRRWRLTTANRTPNTRTSSTRPSSMSSDSRPPLSPWDSARRVFRSAFKYLQNALIHVERLTTCFFVIFLDRIFSLQRSSDARRGESSGKALRGMDTSLQR